MSTTSDKNMIPSSGYIPALDGLRAISIGMVILAHLMLAGQIFTSHERYYVEIGTVGVLVFFVISGYLITSLLLDEEDKCQRISLRRFFIRRGLRLLPALYLYLGVVYLLWMTGYLANIPGFDFVSSLFYFRNYVGTSYETGHLWSLSAEEQFYFFWPALLVFFPARRFLLAGSLIGLMWFCRCLLIVADRIGQGHLLQQMDGRIDTFLLGCSLALFTRANWGHGIKRLLSRSETAIAAVVALFVWNWIGARHIPGSRAINTAFSSVCISLFLYQLLSRPDTIVARILQTRGLVWIGKLSYSLYLWQQLFVAPMDSGLGALRWFPLNVILAFVAAVVSFELIEKPVLRLKRRFAPGAPEVDLRSSVASWFTPATLNRPARGPSHEFTVPGRSL